MSHPTSQLFLLCVHGGQRVSRLVSIVRFTLLAPEQTPDCLMPSLNRDHPWAIHPRWLMAHMLGVAAGQIRHPVADIVLMKTDNRLLYTWSLSATWGLALWIKGKPVSRGMSHFLNA